MSLSPLALAARMGLRSRSLLRPRTAPVPHVIGLLLAIGLALLTGRAHDLLFLGGIAVVIVVLRAPLSELPDTRWRALLAAADAVLTAAALLLTGAPFSPLLPLAMTGALDAGSRSRRDGWLFGLPFLVTYLPVAAAVAVVNQPDVHRAEFLMEVGKTTTLVPLSVLIGWATSAGPFVAPFAKTGPLPEMHQRRAAIRAQVARALGDEPLPVDTLIAGANLGLTVEETELLGFLVMGLTNQQIADAFCLSVATVKYRLTHLYRRLGVRGRPQAIARARQLGLDALPLEPIESLGSMGETSRLRDSS